MTAEEFVKKWGKQVLETTSGSMCVIDDTDDCLLDLRSVIRGKLIEFVDFVNNQYCEDITGNMLDKEDVDEFLNNQ